MPGLVCAAAPPMPQFQDTGITGRSDSERFASFVYRHVRHTGRFAYRYARMP